MTDIPNYLTAEQERVINDFQRLARELMIDGVTFLGAGFYDNFDEVSIHSHDQVFFGGVDYSRKGLAASTNNAIHQFRTKIKPTAEQAQIDYDRAAKALEDAKAKLDALS